MHPSHSDSRCRFHIQLLPSPSAEIPKGSPEIKRNPLIQVSSLQAAQLFGAVTISSPLAQPDRRSMLLSCHVLRSSGSEMMTSGACQPIFHYLCHFCFSRFGRGSGLVSPLRLRCTEAALGMLRYLEEAGQFSKTRLHLNRILAVGFAPTS